MLEEKEKVEKENGLFEHHRIVVDPKQTPIRIDKFLLDRMPKVSRSKIQEAIKLGTIRVNDKEVKSNHKVKPNEIITLVMPKPPADEFQVIPEDIPLDIRYEDDHLMVIHKPAGLVVHPGVGNYSGTLVNGLQFYFQNKNLPVMQGNNPDRPGLVHRIDKGTSGLMVIAKNDYAMKHLAKQFFDHTIERTYWGLIWGELDDDEGTIEGKIGRHDRNRLQMAVYDDDEEGGKHAITHYKVLERLYYVSLVECRLETGRTHQIRVHMKHMGNPLFNDDRYGGDKIIKGTVFTKYKQFVHNCFKIIERPALHARSLGFVHPDTGENMYFEADLPDDFKGALEKWQKYVAGRKEISS